MGRGTRWLLFFLGLFILTIGFWAIAGGLYADAVASPMTSATRGIVAAAVGVAFYVSGCMLCRAVAPQAAALLGALAAPIAFGGAVACALTALVVGQTDPFTIDPQRAAAMAWLGAALCLALAVFGSLNWWHWLRLRGSRAAVRHIKQWLAIGYGALLFVSGLGTAIGGVVSDVSHAGLGRSDLSQLLAPLALAGFAALLLAAGALFVWHGASSRTGVPSGRVRLPPLWAPAAAAALVLALGALLLQADLAVGLVPLAHAALVLLPAVCIVTLAARAGTRLPARARATWRDVLTMVAYGASAATLLAIFAEVLAQATGGFAFLVARGAFRGVHTERQFSHLQLSDFLSKSDQLLLALLTIAVLGPLIEEFCKGYGVRMLREARPSRYQAFLLGVAAGVGFAMFEANEYGLAAFSESPFRWWDTMLVRGGGSSLHALASGIVGLGWYEWNAGRRGRGATLFTLAVGLHGSWNGLNVLVAAR
ncbi:MAG TPA: PrsW family glutamic-type intramembrane protease, partial [Dehalococcoidia bacterium]|nr:PrsW family glutamic-type intramembrane protease [Dehalococcoidia bacterium]